MRENEEQQREEYLEGFLIHLEEAVAAVKRGEVKAQVKGDPATVICGKLEEYLRLKTAYSPFEGERAEKSEAYAALKKLLTPELLKEYKEKSGALAESIVQAENESFRADFDAMATYCLSYAGDKKAVDTLKEFYEAYRLREERKKIEAFCRRDKSFEEGISTGFRTFDEVLEGGLYPGLYVIGAPSSAGKTSFCVQLADQIALKGNKVLFFSLEMSEEELYSKSLSRLTYLLDPDPQKRGAKSERRLTGNKFREKFSEAEWDLLSRSAGQYLTKISPNKRIVESVGEYGVKEIERDVKNYISVTGKKPVVFVDYLQILKPYADNMTDKQNTDRNVSALKRLCRDEKITVFIISSFNRSSYHQVAGLDAFKESGAIEYSADAVFTLQPEGVKYASETDKKAIAENKEILSKIRRLSSRPMVLSVLKNRRGRSGEEISFEYRCTVGLFTELGLKEENAERRVL